VRFDCTLANASRREGPRKIGRGTYVQPRLRRDVDGWFVATGNPFPVTVERLKETAAANGSRWASGLVFLEG